MRASPSCASIQRARLLHHLREFFDEQRHAAGPVVDLLDHRFRQRALHLLPHQVADLAACQAVQGQAGLVGDRRPRRLELGTEGEQGQDRVVQELGEELPKELQRGRIHPVQILDDEQDRLAGSAGVQPVQHAPERFFPLADRRQRKRREPVRGRQRQQRRPQRHGFRPGQVVLLQAMEQAVEPVLRRLLAAEAERTLVEVDGRVQPRVLEMRRAAPFNDRRVHFAFHHLSQDMLLQRVHQARLAQARLADQQDDLSHALLGLLPSVLQQADLLVAAGQRRKLSRRHRLEPAPGRRDLFDPEEFNGLSNALDLLAAEAAALKLALQQPVTGFGADHLTGDGNFIQPDGHIPRVAHQRHHALLGLDDGRPGVDADPRIQVQLVLAEPLAQGLHLLEETEAGACGADCGVLESYRETKTHQQPLLIALHDRSTERLHGVFARLLEPVQHAGLILRVEFQIVSESNRSQPQTRTVTWRRSASRARLTEAALTFPVETTAALMRCAIDWPGYSDWRLPRN